MKIQKILFVSIFLLLQNLCSISAGEYFQPTSDELISDSKFIFIGKIIQIQESYSKAHPTYGKSLIGQKITIEVRSNLKGDISQNRITITTNYTESSSFDKTYTKNDIGVWFVESMNSSGHAKLTDQILGYASFDSYNEKYHLE